MRVRTGHADLGFLFSSRRRHTRFDCDWSSDVCSSDLTRLDPAAQSWARRAGPPGTAATAGAAAAAVPEEAVPGAAAPAAAARAVVAPAAARSEERRVGKEWRSRWAADH